jgi:hypothetical protein
MSKAYCNIDRLDETLLTGQFKRASHTTITGVIRAKGMATNMADGDTQV